MTIYQLFEELRKEPNWNKEVCVLTDGRYVPVRDVVPNIITDDEIFITVKED